MKKSIFGVIVATGIILLMMFCYKDSHQASPQKVITWERLDTFVFVKPMYRVAYPDYFEVNTAELDSGHVSFYYTINGNSVALRSYSIPRYELWDVSSFANSVERLEATPEAFFIFNTSASVALLTTDTCTFDTRTPKKSANVIVFSPIKNGATEVTPKK